MAGTCLNTPDEFRAFPYSQPYSIQVDFMKHVYDSIENRKIAILESPTGTGKTLSLLTSSFTWLHDDKYRAKQTTLEGLRKSLHSPGDPEWVTMQSFERLKSEIESEERDYEEHLAELRSREQAARKSQARVSKKPRLESPGDGSGCEHDDDLLLPDHDGSDGQENQTQFPDSSGTSRLSPSGTKIFFASRTHSQLSQVISELLKLRLVSSFPEDAAGDYENPNVADAPLLHPPRSVSLASRNHLCINERLRAQTADLDEGCRELLSGRREGRCPYLPPLGEEDRLDEFRDRILASPKDIEDLVTTGKDMRLCPYFSCRAATVSAELVALPYNLLLHERSREALGVNLQDQIIIIDEAHNLIDALLQLHTVDLSTPMLQVAIGQLKAYVHRFRTKLNTINAIHLQRLLLFLQALHKSAAQISVGADKVMSVSTFVEGMGNKVNGVNLLELQSYLRSSKIARKISKYSEKSQQNETAEGAKSRLASMLPLHAVETFLEKLTNNAEDGIITVTEDRIIPNKRMIRYQHLNPATYFENVVRSARCVVLAGGTMSPISDMHLQLFPSMPLEQLSVFCCGHVIPQSNLLCLVVAKGPRGGELEFKFKGREDQALIGELGQCLVNLASVCPNGVVVFFPSYSFLDKAKREWTASGLLNRIHQKKKIFCEPSESAAVDDVLQRYGVACVETSGTAKGAMLFAVVGAKLSEGLNFANELARAVVLVGIPYPNIASPELKERIKYVRKHCQSATEKPVDPGSELYENLAMRAVNQSIGRAIRHQHDWSALILVDKRYASQKVQNKLPGWIRQNTSVTQGFGQAVKLLGKFYRTKRPSHLPPHPPRKVD